MIDKTVKDIEKYLKIKLTLCDTFAGINEHDGNKYFNIVLETQIWNSDIYTKLVNIQKFGIFSDVQPNGHKRLAIYF